MPSSARARLAALAAVAALTLAGCASPGGSTAFAVDGERITLGQLEDAAQACAGPLGFPQSAMDAQIRPIGLQALVGRVLAKQNGMSFSDAQVREVLVANDLGAAHDAPGCTPLLHDSGIFALAVSKLGAEEASKQIQAMDVEVNPRLGTWNPQRLELLNTNGSLSKVGPDTQDSQG